jgi:hypothetical protein
MKPLLFLLMSACAWAQIQLPSIGVMLDENGRARPVTGAPAVAVLGQPIFDGVVISLACTAQMCLAKTATALVSTYGDSVPAPPGAAIIAFESGFNGAAAYVYFVATGEFALWSAGVLTPLDFTPAGDVLSLRASAVQVEFATEHDESIWVGDLNLGPANTILLLDDGSALLAANGQVRLLRPDGTELDFAAAGTDSFIGGFIRMNDQYVEVITASGMWALDVEPGHEQISLLPGVAH